MAPLCKIIRKGSQSCLLAVFCAMQEAAGPPLPPTWRRRSLVAVIFQGWLTALSKANLNTPSALSPSILALGLLQTTSAQESEMDPECRLGIVPHGRLLPLW